MNTHENAPAKLAAGQCPVCGSAGSLVAFTDDTLPLVSGGHTVQVEHLAGERCEVCGEAFLDADSQARFSAAGDALVVQARKEVGAHLRRVRRKLHLTQIEAAQLTGGGRNAFVRYESGEVQPVAAVFNLFRLLDRHPNLLVEIRPVELGERAMAMAADAPDFRGLVSKKKGPNPKAGAPRQTEAPVRR